MKITLQVLGAILLGANHIVRAQSNASCEPILAQYAEAVIQERAAIAPNLAPLSKSNVMNLYREDIQTRIKFGADSLQSVQSSLEAARADASKPAGNRIAPMRYIRQLEYHACAISANASQTQGGGQSVPRQPAAQQEVAADAERQIERQRTADRVRHAELQQAAEAERQRNEEQRRRSRDAEATRLFQQKQKRAEEHQAKADDLADERRRRVHTIGAEAHHCLAVYRPAVVPNEAYGGFSNACGFRVDFVFCNFRPKPNSWADALNCESKQGLGGSDVAANWYSVDHTKGAEKVYWFACKYPALPADVEYVPGAGLRGRCS